MKSHQKIMTPLSIFPNYGQFGAIWKPDSGQVCNY